MIPIDSKAVNSFNYPYLASLIKYYVDDRNNEYCQRESYLKKRKIYVIHPRSNQILLFDLLTEY